MKENLSKPQNAYFPVLRLSWKKEWDIEVKFFVKYLVFLIGMLWVMKPEVFAFSIDGFQVRSQYGEKLNANFEIHLDFE